VSDLPSSTAARARADYLAGDPVAARRALEGAPDLDLDAAALLALCWVRQVLSARPHGSCVDGAVLRTVLASPFDHPRLEADRHFALGWLEWLAGSPDQAEPLLATATEALLRDEPAAAGEASYWLARVRLGLGHADAVADFEQSLRTIPASPQTTCWFVDLLWRSGQLDRADGVWKTVRGNRRVMGCDEAPLLEARALLHRDETTAAERLLNDANPRGGVAQVERLLLLAWLSAVHGQGDRAADYLRQSETGPYPPAALDNWRRHFQLRRAPQPDWPVAPGPLDDWRAAQRARAEGHHEEAAAALARAGSVSALHPFVRYVQACLGDGDFAAVLASQPGWFLAVRCRARLGLHRFCRRQASAGELLEALQQADAAGYRLAGTEHYRRLALALKQRNPHAEDLRRLAVAPAAEGEAAARNALRAAAELAARLLPPAEALGLLREWAPQAGVRADRALAAAVGTHLLRLLLLCPPGACEVGPVLSTAVTMVGTAALPALVREWLDGADRAPPPAPDEAEPAPLVQLWRAALALRDGIRDSQRWREGVAAARSHPALRGVAQCLLLREAAERRDIAAMIVLLEDVDAWRGFASGPPGLASEAVLALAAVAAHHPRWRAALARWLQVWDASSLDAGTRALAVRVGLIRLDPAIADVPAGLPAVPWLLHQAAQAVLREDAREALAWVRRARAIDPDLSGQGERLEVLRAALPDLERLARAQLLADVIRFDPAQPAAHPRLLVGAAGALERDGDGAAILAAAERGELPAARQALAALAGRDNLAPDLAHHLAVIYHRAALFLEERERDDDAGPYRRLAWRCWLQLLASLGPAITSQHPLLLHLLGRHRRRMAALLARDQIEPARRHWALVQQLPELARLIDGNLGGVLAELAVRFREELATEQIVATREAMRYGAIAEGWRADYERGLAGLVRLLSLDEGNGRLLTALVETCNEFFHDCYVNEDSHRLWESVERYTPFALRLGLLADRREADLTGRAALAEFYKFRGFVAPERERKLALFREALAFDPRNENVRQLLEQTEKPTEARR
jgi:hypothetical protein